MYTELLRKHVKLCSFDEIQNQLSAVIPERFTMEQKSALASSVCVVIFSCCLFCFVVLTSVI